MPPQTRKIPLQRSSGGLLADSQTPVSVVGAGIKISDHARDRAKERLGLTGESVKKAALKAWTDGLLPRDTTGTLKRYLDKLSVTHGRAIRLHADHLYVFVGRNPPVLIAILHLPHELRRSAASATKKRKANP